MIEVALTALILGMGTMLFGTFRTATRRQAPALKAAVAITRVGSGLAALGLALLVLAKGPGGVITIGAAVIFGAVAISQLTRAALIRRSSE